MSDWRAQAPAPGELRPFRFPDVWRDRLANGMAVMGARHGAMPLVTLALVVRGGGAAEPAAGAGVAALTASLLSSGTRQRDADELARAVESLGISIDARAGWDACFVRMTVPRERLDAATRLFAEVVREPAFPEHEVERLRGQQLASLLQRRKQPGTLAGDAAARHIFSRATPWARPLIGTPATVEALTRRQVLDFYDARFRADAATLIVAGDASREEARRLAERCFGDWQGGAKAAPEAVAESALQGASVFVVDRPGSVQSEIRIGHIGVQRDTPDYFPLLVMNTILGGSFTSRLNMNLRERHGFTYGVRSGFSMRRRPGPFLVQTAVANDVTGRAVEEVLNEIRRLRDGGPTERELDAARDYVGGILPLQLQTTDQLAARLDDLVVYDLPDDWFQHYRDRIAAVDADDVSRVARRYLDPDRIAVIVAGAADEVVPQLESLGIGPVVRESAAETASADVPPTTAP